MGVHAELKEESLLDFKKHVKLNDNGCWMWVGPKSHRGDPAYRTILGTMSHNAKYYAWNIVHGVRLEEGQRIKSLCGVKDCVNPEHYRLQVPRVKRVVRPASELTPVEKTEFEFEFKRGSSLSSLSRKFRIEIKDVAKLISRISL